MKAADYIAPVLLGTMLWIAFGVAFRSAPLMIAGGIGFAGLSLATLFLTRDRSYR